MPCSSRISAGYYGSVRRIALTALLAALPAFADGGPDGAALYKKNCALCHGVDGSGQTPAGKSLHARDLRSPEVQKMTNKELFTIIAEGKAAMPGYKATLTQSDIDALITFIRELKK
jgi:mono/diheme cytochrome c family protein